MNLFARSRCCVLLGLVGVISLTGCGASRTPEKVFSDWSNAVKVGDFRGAWECLTPQTRGTTLQILVLDADLLSENSAAAKTALDQVFQKHGLNPQDAAFKQQRLNVANPVELAADLDGVFRQYMSELEKLPGSRYAKLNAIWTASAGSGLAQSQMDGMRATAALQGKIPHVPENSAIQAVFEKINNQWLFSELEQTGGGAAVASNQAGGAAMAGMPGGTGMPGGGMPGGGMPGGGMPGNAGGPTGPGAMGVGGPGADPRMMMNSGGGLPTNPGQQPGGAGTPAMDPKMMMKAGGGLPINPGQAPAGGAPAMDPQAMMKARGGFPVNPGQPPGGGAAAPADPRSTIPGGANPANPGQAVQGLADPNNRRGDPRGAVGGNPVGQGLLDPRGRGADAGAAGRGDNPGNAGFAAGGNGSGGQNRQAKSGSFEQVINDFTSKMAAGDYTDLDSLIGSKAKGLLAELRDGEISDDQKTELAAAFESASVEADTRKNRGATLEVHVKGKQGHLIILAAGKEGGEFKIREMKINEPGATKKR